MQDLKGKMKKQQAVATTSFSNAINRAVTSASNLADALLVNEAINSVLSNNKELTPDQTKSFWSQVSTLPSAIF